MNKIDRSTKGFQAFLVGTALLPFALAICFYVRGPAAQAAAKGEPRTSLVFNQYLVNLGEVPPGKPFVHAFFRFFNAGSTPVTLKTVRASCECINPQLRDRKMVYEPGESGQLYVTIDAPKEDAGEKEYVITVPYEDPQAREIELNFRATLPVPQVAVHPRALLFYQLDGQESTQQVAVVDNRATPLNVLGVESSSPLVSVKLEAAKVDGRVHTATISVTVPAKVPEQRIHEFLTVRTDDKEYSTLKIPVMIEGRKVGFSNAPGNQNIPPAKAESR
jgi:hypothetical protein